MRRSSNGLSLSLALFVSLTMMASGAESPLLKYKRVVFLGDSITYAGTYITDVESVLRLKYPDFSSEFIDLGLPSETVSGLSEPGHAGGSFPRPTLHERLDRVLAKAKPDLVIACYGMNDGIYYPLSDERFAKYQVGIKLLRTKVLASGAKLIHLTPPVFDSEPIKERTLPAGLEEYRQPYFGYDEVLTKYADWLISMRAEGWEVVDIHGPMRLHLDRKRKEAADFIFAQDGVHSGPEGHWIIAKALLTHWNSLEKSGEESESATDYLQKWPEGKAVHDLIHKRQEILKLAWLSETGHVRPGIAKGLPMPEAETKAKEINDRIAEEIKKAKN